MSYSSFKDLNELENKFDLEILSEAPMFREAEEVQPSEQISFILEDNVPLALNINTEKARSELMIAPVLVEVWRQLDRKVSLFSGIDFSVDASLNLNGYCDFILSDSPNQVFLKVPVVCVVEAKNENIKSGYAQCIAEMVAAQIFNKRQNKNVRYILGVVTTGSNWKFLKFQGNKVLIDFDEYLISQVKKILGIFVACLHEISLR